MPPEHRWQWIKWEVFGGPQDKYMRALIKAFYRHYRRSATPLFIIGYRGSRKSTVARGCARSIWSVVAPFWTRPSCYIGAPSGPVDWSELADKHTGYFTAPWEKDAAWIASRQYSGILFAVVGLFLALLQSDAVMTQLLAAQAVETLRTIAVSVMSMLGAYLFLAFPYETVLFIDGPLGKKVEESNPPTEYSPELKLEQLKDLKVHTLVVVTSNEGLSWCFDDTAAGLYRIVKMIAPTDEELYFALQNAARQPGSDLSKLRELTPSLIKKVTALLPEHHSRSVSFWTNVHHEILSPCLDDSRLALSVPTLMRIVESLDLDCDPTFRVMALVYSPELTSNELQQVRQLVRSSFARVAKTAAATDAARATATHPRSVFRRVALLWCITQEWEYYRVLAPEDLEAIDDGFRRILKSTLNPNEICTLSATRGKYGSHLSWVFDAVIDAQIRVAEAYGRQSNIDKQVEVLKFLVTLYEEGSIRYINALLKVAEAYGRLNNIDEQVVVLKFIPTLYDKGSFEYMNATKKIEDPLIKAAEAYDRQKNIDKQVEVLKLIPTLYDKGSFGYMNATEKIEDPLIKAAEAYGRQNDIDKQVEVLEFIPTLYEKGSTRYIDAVKKIDAAREVCLRGQKGSEMR